jgi:probable RNA-binding protein EIF1AD
MAGLGRRTHYRKHLTDAVLNDLPEPKEHERIAKVVATRGGNQFDILLSTTVEEDRTPQLALLPTKFHKLVWVKRGDYVIVQTGGKAHEEEKDNDDETGIRFIISHILYKDQVKHLQIKGLWPEKDPEFNRDAVRGGGAEDGEAQEDADEEDDDASQDEGDDGIVYSTGYEDDDDLFVNTNRIAKLNVQDSDSEEDSD